MNANKSYRFVVNEGGLSLIETLLAVTMIIIVVAALFQLAVTSLRSTDSSKLRSQATQLSEQAIEGIRALRDNDSAGFFALADGYYAYNGSGLINFQTTLPSLPDSNYQVSGYPQHYRIVHLTQGTDSMNITVTTYWQDHGRWLNVPISTILTRWR